MLIPPLLGLALATTATLDWGGGILSTLSSMLLELPVCRHDYTRLCKYIHMDMDIYKDRDKNLHIQNFVIIFQICLFINIQDYVNI
jgi:hypothetical protein